ncbi:conserved hypothetical protein [Gloeothece citriformis PCC 7424]|uniref:PhoD-like phosphatase metallophosphatase domain-containing protein n=1 Tax=Gloeothece citriformis (strain PCC 7424) TaxID=65393 RepID=B7KIK9_GLOC7|nr:hypothetical protein [Gloeothece citriformis]ACK69415.1 conserved hypothetical protein [Gloeothece citriformis PCC 7424]
MFDMAWISLNHRLEQLPLILAGPMLRRTEPEAVTVWVALRSPAKVTLNIYRTQQGEIIETEEIIAQGKRSTVEVGQHLHIVAVTAKIIGNNPLQSGQIYAYDLNFDLDRVPAQNLQQALQSSSYSSASISYFSHELPTFVLPPSDLNKLHIVHGSCRKPQGEGQDALPILDDLLEKEAIDPNNRVHQLFLTGDQIYGDDVADSLLMIATDIGDTLLGWEEALPHSHNPDKVKPKHLKPGQRSQIADEKGGLTAGLRRQPERAKSHLFSLGEFCGMYLLTWSPVLWPEKIPTAKDINKKGKQAKNWDKEVKELRKFFHTLGKVRRVFANVATYTIFDDHDISDDWYLNQEWCLRVLGKPLGKRTVENGLLAYTLFQGWGNTPEQFEPEKTGEKLLLALQTLAHSRGNDLSVRQAIADYLGLPPLDPVTALPSFKRDGEVLILERDPQALTWHYTLRFKGYEILVLDTRTWRGYPTTKKTTTSPPMLLSPTAFERQIKQPLDQTDELCKQGLAQIDLTILIAPTNLISLKLIDKIQHWNLRQKQVYNNDVGDSWNVHKSALAKLLNALFRRREQVIVLSGDIHYGSAIRCQYWQYLDQRIDTKMMAQLTASAFCNSEVKTRLVHTKLKSLLPEPTRQWVGWLDPPTMIEITKTQELKANQWQPPLDWSYQIEWIKRPPAITLRHDVPWLKTYWQPKFKGWNHIKNCFLKLWRNRWLHEGEEVVGLNNFGLVTFNFSEDNTLNSVTQDLYWCPPWELTSIVYSRYSVNLNQPENCRKTTD